MAKKQPTIMRIELTAPAKEKLTKLSKQQGMTQVAMMSRVVEWFTGLNDLIQPAIVGHYPKEIEADVARLILKRVGK